HLRTSSHRLRFLSQCGAVGAWERTSCATHARDERTTDGSERIGWGGSWRGAVCGSHFCHHSSSEDRSITPILPNTNSKSFKIIGAKSTRSVSRARRRPHRPPPR